jgi:hypothetical protein
LPSEDVYNTDELVVVDVVAHSLTFKANPGGGLEAVLKNALSSFVVGSITSSVVERIRRGVTLEAVRGVNATLGDESSARLPEGVVLSMRGLDHLSTGVRAWGALGAFGDILARFPNRPSTGGGRCPLQLLALQAGPVLSLQLFRGYRDEHLPAVVDGSALRAAYYRHAPEATRLLLSHPSLALRARRLATRLQRALLAGRVSPPLVVETDRLLDVVRELASPALRRDIEHARQRLQDPDLLTSRSTPA